MLCSYDVQRYHTALVQAGGNADGLTEKSKALKAKIAEIEEREREVIKARDGKLMSIGNLVHDSVPISQDEVCAAEAVTKCQASWHACLLGQGMSGESAMRWGLGNASTCSSRPHT